MNIDAYRIIEIKHACGHMGRHYVRGADAMVAATIAQAQDGPCQECIQARHDAAEQEEEGEFQA